MLCNRLLLICNIFKWQYPPFYSHVSHLPIRIIGRHFDGQSLTQLRTLVSSYALQAKESRMLHESGRIDWMRCENGTTS